MKAIKFLTLFTVCLLLLPTTSEAQRWGKKRSISGEGPLVKKTLDIDGFTNIGLGLSGTLYLTQGNTYKVEIEAQQNIIDELNKEVKNDGWSIGFENGVNAKNYKKVTVWVTLPNVGKASIAGSGAIYSKGAFNNLGDLKLSIAGSGNIEFMGDADFVELNIAGSGKIDARDLKAADAKVSIAGSGTSYIHVDNGDLKVSVAGSGNVYYKGKASIKTSIAGSGKVASIE